MDYFTIFGYYLLLIGIILIQHFRYRILLREKTHEIQQLDKEQTRLATELENALIEKKTLEDILQFMLSEKRSDLNSKTIIKSA